jgi:hypothetical protein
MTQLNMTTAQRFALNQWLTEYPETMSYEQIIETMVGDSEEWTHDDITVWQVVENFTLRQVADFIEDTRAHFECVTQ